MLIFQVYDKLAKKPFGSTFEADSLELALRSVKNSLFTPQGDRMPGIPYLDLEIRCVGVFLRDNCCICPLGSSYKLEDYMRCDGWMMIPLAFADKAEDIVYFSYDISQLIK